MVKIDGHFRPAYDFRPKTGDIFPNRQRLWHMSTTFVWGASTLVKGPTSYHVETLRAKRREKCEDIQALCDDCNGLSLKKKTCNMLKNKFQPVFLLHSTVFQTGCSWVLRPFRIGGFSSRGQWVGKAWFTNQRALALFSTSSTNR